MSELWKALISHARHCPNRPALQDPSGNVSYAGLLSEINTRTSILRRHSVRVLGLALPNGNEWVLWDLAARRAGVVCVPIPYFFTEQQVAHVFTDAGIDGLIDQRGFSRIRAEPVKFNPDICKVTYTSGSTAAPKGVCLTARGLEQVSLSLLEVLGTTFTNQHLSVLPLSVLLENVAGVYPALISGCTIHLPDCKTIAMNPLRLHEAIRVSKASSAIVVPEILRGQLSLARSTASALPSLQFLAVGGAKVSKELVQQSRAAGLPVYEGYGLSECASVVALNTPQQDKPGTVGKILPHLNVSIEHGEIVIDNPSASGYLGQAGMQQLKTGDCGHFDSDGFLKVTGRKKNVLITSWGRNISPEWVESKLLDQEGIRQAIVLGDGEASLDALIVAANDTSTHTVTETIASINETLPEYARVSRWRRVDPFTLENGLLTGNGRPVRGQIARNLSIGDQHEYIRIF
ncbi:hypothetical protein AB833_27885 [Chromatiales bacterium (ex Bugula neritina AB1)]|nr:hypothetical protein AB833_27885 [Chromatiales bacterium (ex Bugula neritina AB1)]